MADFSLCSRTESITYLSPNTEAAPGLTSSPIALSSARSRNHSASSHVIPSAALKTLALCLPTGWLGLRL